MIRTAYISENGLFRYALARVWSKVDPTLLVVMLNPSTADALQDDPTVTRLIHRAQAAQYGGLLVCNLYAYRATDPKELEKRHARAQDIIGPENNDVIKASARKCGHAAVAWGAHPLVKRREQTVLNLLYETHPRLLMIDRTKDGYPKHPLHVAYARTFQPYDGRFANSLTL